MKRIVAWPATIVGILLSMVSATVFGYLLWENWIKIWIYYGGSNTYYHDGAPNLGEGIGLLILAGLGVVSGIVAFVSGFATRTSDDICFKYIRRLIFGFSAVGVIPPLLILFIAVVKDWSQPLWR